MAAFTSSFTIGHRVVIQFFQDQVPALGVVRAVCFTDCKVTYDIDTDFGGETLRNVDSIFVKEA